jgi:multicomponent Na+:H+ antiporter subunit D
MIEFLPPGAILILGAALVPLLKGRVRQAYMLALPLLGLAQLYALSGSAPLEMLQFSMFGYELTPVRVDKLSLVWGYVFYIAAFLSVLYALKVERPGEHVAAMAYSGGAIAAAFAGDLITLFVFWEVTAITSVFLIWSSRTERSYRAGVRYLVIQVASGVLLLAGALVRVHQTGSVDFGFIGLEGAGGTLIFLAFGIKAAFPFLHNWLQDAYPEATVTGTVWLSAFTTKLAIYALARGFAGTEILIYIGAAMCAFPIFYAVIENDLRRVLAYSLNNQLGFMVVGIGIGTELALNGTAAHAFSHIIYKGLLFMAMGAILQQVGTAKGSELGGVYKSMPWSATFCIIGAASISAFPLFSGFVSKSLVMTASADNHYTLVYLVMLFASAGVVEHAGVKIPYFGFFGPDRGIRVKEAPLNMLLAMGIAAALCIVIGIFPRPLYDILPFPVEYEPYTATHVITQLQLLVWAILGVAVLKWYHIYPPELRSVNVDIDIVYRKWLPTAWAYSLRAGGAVWNSASGAVTGWLQRTYETTYRYHGPEAPLARTWPSGYMAMWTAILLLAVLLALYI